MSIFPFSDDDKKADEYRLFLAGWGTPKKKKKKRRVGRNNKRFLCARDGGHQTVNGTVHAPCRYCKKLFKLEALTVDHVIPLSRGGSNQLTNKVLACKLCNKAKGNKLPEELTTRYFRKLADL